MLDDNDDVKAPLHQHQQWTESSEGDVGSLIDCLDEEEEEEDDDIHPTDNEKDASGTSNTNQVTDTAKPMVDCSYADKYRQQRLNEAANHQMAKSPRPEGLTFNVNEPWQRSMMKQLEQQHDDSRCKHSSERIFVGHTESRDYAVSWDDEASAFSLDTTASSTIPLRVQSIHRMTAPRVIGYQHNAESGTYTVGTPEPKPEGRDDSLSKSMAVSPRTVTDLPVPPRTKHSMGNYVGDIEHTMDDSYNVPDDPACYCLGYNMLDYLLIGTPGPQRHRQRRRSLRPMTRVTEDEPLEPPRRTVDTGR